MPIEVKEHSGNIIIENAKNFDLGHTFDCGQCFRWLKQNNEYVGIVGNKKLHIKQQGNTIILKNTSLQDFKNTWELYFDLNTDYESIINTLKKASPFMNQACMYAPGIRILNQDPWEALCSFIISQNNNIPRIKKIIQKMCVMFGEKIGPCENDFSFPTPKKLAELKECDLSEIKCGFRAKYILDAARKVESKEINLEKISALNLHAAENELIKIKGVGPKVAQCALLYGMHKLDAFPMDVWIKKVMNKFFPCKTPEAFGKYAGIAQQYLYYYSRAESKTLFEKDII